MVDELIKQNEAVSSVRILNEIIDTANELPIECQERILDILRGMSFTKKSLAKESEQLDESKE